MNILSNMASHLDMIESFKMEIDKRTSFSKEEKSEILKAFSISIFSGMISSKSQIQSTSKGVESSIETPKGYSGKYQTFAEMVRATKFKQHPDLILLATYFLASVRRVESVTTLDIETEYSSAMLRTSTNTNANINVNRAKGFMMEGEKRDGKKTFKITMSGMDYIETILNSSNK